MEEAHCTDPSLGPGGPVSSAEQLNLNTDVDVLLESSDSTGEEGNLDLTFEEYDDEGFPKGDPDLYEVRRR